MNQGPSKNVNKPNEHEWFERSTTPKWSEYNLKNVNNPNDNQKFEPSTTSKWTEYRI